MIMKKAADAFASAAMFVATAVLSFAVTAALSCGICWGFGIEWTWRLGLGVWLSAIAVKVMFPSWTRGAK